MKRYFIIALAYVLACTMAAVPADAKKRREAEPEIKYVFMMIGDGMGINSAYGAQLYNKATGKGPEEINFLHFPGRTIVTTQSASSLVTDSAAAGSAISTGHKTKNGSIGVDKDMEYVSSISEWAKEKGFGTGIATSVGINHATPSAYYAHQESRTYHSAIVYDYINSEVDFLAGGGVYEDHKKNITTEELEKKIAESGITILRGDEIENAENIEGRILCLGNDPKLRELKFAIDQQENDTNLSDFVKAGIEYLDGHYGDKGFFFMVEGGKIDYSNHGNDAVGAFHEVNDFAAAIDVAIEFYNEHPEETLIIVTADHETGGIILGSGKYQLDLSRLAWQNESEDVLTTKFRDSFAEKSPSWEEVKAFLSENLGLWEHVKVDEEFENRLKSSVEEMAESGEEDNVKNLYSVNSKIVYDAVIYLAEASGINWAHSGHSGSPVGLFVLGPGAGAFNSCKDNTDIPKTIAKLAGY